MGVPMKRDITGDEVKISVLDMGVDTIPHHECSICGVMVKYQIVKEQLFFDSSCNCMPPHSPEHCTWQSAADWINMQREQKHRVAVAAKFGIDLSEEEALCDQP